MVDKPARPPLVIARVGKRLQREIRHLRAEFE
jgi:hypothetical protein